MNDSMKKEWMIVCPKCGRQKTLRSAGGVRIGAASIGKRTLGYCTKCRKLRLVKIVWANADP